MGGTLGGAWLRRASYQNLWLELEDGARVIGDLHQNVFSLNAAAMAVYRMDTGERLAPVARLELGATVHLATPEYFDPHFTGVRLPLPLTPQGALTARLVLALEYRIADHWVASLGVAARASLGGLTPWQVEVPASVSLLLW